MSEIKKVVAARKPTLPERFKKQMTFGHWLINILIEQDFIKDREGVFDILHHNDETVNQIEFYQDFENNFKDHAANLKLILLPKIKTKTKNKENYIITDKKPSANKAAILLSETLLQRDSDSASDNETNKKTKTKKTKKTETNTLSESESESEDKTDKKTKKPKTDTESSENKTDKKTKKPKKSKTVDFAEVESDILHVKNKISILKSIQRPIVEPIVEEEEPIIEEEEPIVEEEEPIVEEEEPIVEEEEKAIVEEEEPIEEAIVPIQEVIEELEIELELEDIPELEFEPKAKNTKKAAKKPIEKAAKKVAKKPIEKVAKKPIEKVAKKSIEKPIEKPIEKSALDDEDEDDIITIEFIVQGEKFLKDEDNLIYDLQTQLHIGHFNLEDNSIVYI
jgi:hypothetical protein